MPRKRHIIAPGALGVLLCVACSWWHKWSRLQVLPSVAPQRLSFDQRRNYMRRFGRFPSAYLHLQDGLKHFELLDVGLVTYYAGDLLGRMNLVCAPPLCVPDRVELLVDHFLREVPGQMIFGGVDAATAKCLRCHGYQTTVLGTDFSIPVQNFQIAGGRMKHLRRIRNLHRQGLVVREQTWDEVDQDTVRAISDAWLGSKSGPQKELRALTRPAEFADEWQVRKFYVYGSDGAMLGFVHFDPYFRRGRVLGYTANILRAWPEARPHGLLDYAVLCALEKFRDEGVEALSLGMSPLHGIRRTPGDNEALAWLLNTTYEYGEAIYPFKGVASHKSRWRGDQAPLYACTKDVDPLRAVLFTLQMTNTL
mmetsp:Transcript_99964/g.214105  ORF Transcript_99964/g.214105 Transcript_99964/m.214105 type:complete len:365 (+) Transcript_99964:94-1188(+)